MNVIQQFDRTVANMMAKFGTTAKISVPVQAEYDPSTSENVVHCHDYPVQAMFFDYVRKNEGLGTERDTLVQTGDKQVYVQPPQKLQDRLPLPQFSPAGSFLKVGQKMYKIITVKQINPSLSSDGCVLYEFYVRE